MSDDEPGEGLRPEEDFEIVEVDLTPYLTEEQRSWPVGEGLRPEEDFAIEEAVPIPMLKLAVAADPDAAAAAASDCEAGLGGTGLDERGRRTADGVTTLTLVPRTFDGAAERLARVARIAAGLAGTRSATVA